MALHYARVLDEMSEPADPASLRHDLAQEIRALLALERAEPSNGLYRRSAEALQILGARPRNMARWTIAIPLERRPIWRMLRAEALYRERRYDEALAWFGTVERQARTWEYVLLAPAYFRMAEIYERQGDRQAALDYYTRFVDRWRNADPEYAKQVNDARKAIARLSR